MKKQKTTPYSHYDTLNKTPLEHLNIHHLNFMQMKLPWKRLKNVEKQMRYQTGTHELEKLLPVFSTRKCIFTSSLGDSNTKYRPLFIQITVSPPKKLANTEYCHIQWNLSIADMLYSGHLSVADTFLKNG